MSVCAQLCAPFGRVCTIVQGKAEMYGTEFMAKSLTFIWCLIGTKPVYQVNIESHHKVLTALKELVEKGIIKSHLTKKLPLTHEGLKEAHKLIEEGSVVGKVALGVKEAEAHGKKAFM